MKKSIYVAGPRMGQNNFLYGMELKSAPKPRKSPKVNTSKSKKKKK